MPTLLLIRGLPGAGKTTIAQTLVKSGLFQSYYEADMWMKSDSGQYDFNTEKLSYCHRKCFLSAEEDLRDGKSVIVSNTSLSLWSVDHYRNLARENNADFQIMELKSPWKSVHGIPKAQMTVLAGKWENVV